VRLVLTTCYKTCPGAFPKKEADKPIASTPTDEQSYENTAMGWRRKVRLLLKVILGCAWHSRQPAAPLPIV